MTILYTSAQGASIPWQKTWRRIWGNLFHSSKLLNHRNRIREDRTLPVLMFTLATSIIKQNRRLHLLMSNLQVTALNHLLLCSYLMEVVQQWDLSQLESRWATSQKQLKLQWLHTLSLLQVFQESAMQNWILMVPLIKESRLSSLMGRHILQGPTMLSSRTALLSSIAPRQKLM